MTASGSGRRRRVLLDVSILAGAWLALAGCSSSSSPGGDAGASTSLPATFAVTADWLNHTVSLVDLGALLKGAKTRKAALLGQLDLSSYAQGPLSVRITPDGKTALVSLSSGFFAVPGAGSIVGATVPTGPGKLLFVDLESATVAAALDTGDGPMEIAMTHDGTRAFMCHFSTGDVSVIDVKARTVLQQVNVGPDSEEITLDDTDTVGIFAYSTDGDVRTFAVADMASTLSPTVSISGDSAGVAFFPGTKTAYVVQSYNGITSLSSGYTLVDVTNPQMPVKLADVRWTDATYIDYPALAAPARGTVLVPVASSGKLALREYGLGQGDVVLKNTFDVAPTALFGAYGLALDSQGHVIMTMPAEHLLAVLDLETKAAFTVPWGTQAGPTGIDVH